MKMFNVYNGDFPFDDCIATISADNEVHALEEALRVFGNHCVVEPCDGINVIKEME